jgi:surface antigen
MEKLLPGIEKLSTETRQRIGIAFLFLGAISLVMPIIAFASMGPACGGGYPDTLCKAPLNSKVDNWGMYNRQCVSYTAYRVATSGRTMPYGFGDANRWPAAARAHGIAVDARPRVGDVAIRTDNNHGHSMYVEAINTDGTLVISQYNVNKTGTYSRDTIKSDGLQFIHF